MVDIREAGPNDAGEVLTVQRAAWVTEAQLHNAPSMPPLALRATRLPDSAIRRRPDPSHQEAGAGMSLFGKIDHVGIAVPDLDEAIAFYRDTFGIVSVHEEVNEEQGVREAMLAVGDGETMIQLLAPLSETSTIAKFLDRNGPGVQQLAYTVEDIDAVSAALRAKGVRLLYEVPRQGTAGSRVNFIHPKDARGVLVELVEPAKVTHE